MTVSFATVIVIFILCRGKLFESIYRSVEVTLAVKFLNCSFKPHRDLRKFANFFRRFIQVFKTHVFNLGKDYLHQMPLFSIIFDSSSLSLIVQNLD